MRTLDGELGDVLVVMSGYDDPVWTIDEAITAVVDEARSQGVGAVVWLTGCLRAHTGSGRNEHNRRLAKPVAGNGGAVARDGDDLDGDERVGSRVVEGLHGVDAVPP